MQKLNMVDADTLLYQPLDKPRFVVDGFIPTGLILFCGSQKIGKSWLMLKLCLCVSAGLPFWEMETRAGDVLYLCLEDTFFRIQDRLFRLTDEADSRLHFAVASCKLTDGLIVQLEDYLKEYPDPPQRTTPMPVITGIFPRLRSLPTGIPLRSSLSTISASRTTAMCSTRYRGQRG